MTEVKNLSVLLFINSVTQRERARPYLCLGRLNDPSVWEKQDAVRLGT